MNRVINLKPCGVEVSRTDNMEIRIGDKLKNKEGKDITVTRITFIDDKDINKTNDVEVVDSKEHPAALIHYKETVEKVEWADHCTPADEIENKIDMEDYYAIVKHTRQDFCGATQILAIASNYDAAKKRFDEAVAFEKKQQEKFGYSYDTVEESENLYEAYDEGYEATDSISIIISKAPFIG